MSEEILWSLDEIAQAIKPPEDWIKLNSKSVQERENNPRLFTLTAWYSQRMNVLVIKSEFSTALELPIWRTKDRNDAIRKSLEWFDSEHTLLPPLQPQEDEIPY